VLLVAREFIRRVRCCRSSLSTLCAKPLVREDTGRFLRQSDLKAGGAANLLYWNEATGKLTVAPGCEGDGAPR